MRAVSKAWFSGNKGSPCRAISSRIFIIRTPSQNRNPSFRKPPIRSGSSMSSSIFRVSRPAQVTGGQLVLRGLGFGFFDFWFRAERLECW